MNPTLNQVLVDADTNQPIDLGAMIMSYESAQGEITQANKTLSDSRTTSTNLLAEAQAIYAKYPDQVTPEFIAAFNLTAQS